MASGASGIAAHEAELLDYAMGAPRRDQLAAHLRPRQGKGAIVSFNIEGAHAHDVAPILDRYGVAVRAGTHCAEPLLARFGVTATCRASFALYNTMEEVDTLVEALHQSARDVRLRPWPKWPKELKQTTPRPARPRPTLGHA